MVIAFDFDGTIAKSTRFHRSGWEAVVNDIGTAATLDELLPYEANLKERFDSYRRIKEGFLLKDDTIRRQVEAYFGTNNEDELTKKIMNHKESSTIKSILEEETYDLLDTVALNLTPALITLKTKNIKTAIISSSRRTIVNAFILKANLVDLFNLVIGEEDLYLNEALIDKPNEHAANVLKQKIGVPMTCYIGDNDVIDREFAHNSKSAFIYATHKDDMLSVLGGFI